MLKALAHPLRRRIIKLFRSQDYARAADIAAALDVPANSVSFHLRVLAEAGLIHEVPEHARDRRDRVWAATRGAWTLGSPEHPTADEVLASALHRTLIDDHLDLVRRVAAWSPEYISGRSSEAHGTFYEISMRLTPAEFEALEKRILQIVQEAKAAHDADDPDSRAWDLHIIAADETI